MVSSVLKIAQDHYAINSTGCEGRERTRRGTAVKCFVVHLTEKEYT